MPVTIQIGHGQTVIRLLKIRNAREVISDDASSEVDVMIQGLKCFFELHDWEDTGIRRMYGFVYLMKCKHCGTMRDMTPENVSFGKIGGQEIMMIRQGKGA